MPREVVEIPLREEVTQGMAEVAEAFDASQQAIEQHGASLRKVERELKQFGASQQEQAASTQRIVEVNEQLSGDLSITARIYRGLLKDTQDVGEANRLLAEATAFARESNLTAEQAARKYAQTARGQTAAFRELNSRADRLGDILDTIKDKNLRAEIATRALSGEITRADNAVDKFTDRLAVMRFRAAQATGGFDLMTPGLKALGVGVAAVTAAVAASAAAIANYTVQATKAYIEKTPQYKAELDRLRESQDELATSVGKIGAETINAKNLMQEATIAVRLLGEDVKEADGFFDGLGVTLDRMVLTFLNVSSAAALATKVLARPTQVAEAVATFQQQIQLNEAISLSIKRRADVERKGIALERKLNKVIGDITGGTRKLADAAKGAKAKLDELTFDVADDALITDAQTGVFASQEAFARVAELRAERNAAEEADRAARIANAIEEAEIQRQLVDQQEEAFARFVETGKGLLAVPEAQRQMAINARATAQAFDAAAAEQEMLTQTTLDGGAAVGVLTDQYANLITTMAEGTRIQGGFINALVGSLGDLLVMSGKAFITMGAGALAISTGITNPLGLIAIGAGAVTLGAALRGFSNKGAAIPDVPEADTASATGSGGGGGFSDGPSLGSGFRADVGGRTSRLVVNIAGRQVDGVIEDAALDSMDRNRVETASRLARYRPRQNRLRG